LRHVDQTARQVSRVSRLQGRIGQAFTSTVSGNEVLQYVQALAEVRSNGRFDNRTVRLGHQAAHTGKLANLGGGTPGTRVGHHVDRVERFLALFFAVAIGDGLGGKLFHHGLADLITGLAPDVDHVVITLLRRNQTRRILLVDFLYFFAGLRKDVFLDRRYQHVAHGDRNTAARRPAE